MEFKFDATIKAMSTKKGEEGPVSTIQLEAELMPDEAANLHELMSLGSFIVTMSNEQGVFLRRQQSKSPEVGFDGDVRTASGTYPFT